jgi:hypothetical protein
MGSSTSTSASSDKKLRVTEVRMVAATCP